MDPCRGGRRVRSVYCISIAAAFFCWASASGAATLYVSVNSTNARPPYSSWEFAASTIQDAVDQSKVGDLVLVTNGIYQTGGRSGSYTGNRVLVTNAISIQSINGPAVTRIVGDSGFYMRCAYLASGSSLSGFTLTGGRTASSGDPYMDQSGGGLFCADVSVSVSNCVINGNLSIYGGGGVHAGTLFNCTLVSNTVFYPNGTGGGGADGSILSYCVLTGNSANHNGGGANACALNHCSISNNTAHAAGAGVSSCTLDCSALLYNVADADVGQGGGAFYSSLTNCILIGNSAGYGGGGDGGSFTNCYFTNNIGTHVGGGAANASLTSCTLISNSASLHSSDNGGGGAYSCNLTSCSLIGNQSGWVGGATSSGFLANCSLVGNWANIEGGGAWNDVLLNCAVSGNSAMDGGGVYGATLDNCTVTGNSASSGGGGVEGGTNNNCIVYFNQAPVGSNYLFSILNYSCSTPLPSGTGNIGEDPLLSSASHLSAESPCLRGGSSLYSSGVDIDGELWGNPPSIGCDEFYANSATGSLYVRLQASFTTVAVGFPVKFSAAISGPTTSSRWEFGDGTIVSNQPYSSHSWTAAGDFPVVLRAYNASYSNGVTAALTIHVLPEVHYVSLNSFSPTPPYNSWSTAATDIQSAVDAVSLPGALVLVSNGVYNSGSRIVFGAMANRVVATNPVVVQSLNGPGVTSIQAYSFPGPTNATTGMRCVYLTNSAILSGFTLANGITRAAGDQGQEQSGGAVWCGAFCVVTNCILAGNTAAFQGGGAYSGAYYVGTINNCIFTGNSAGNGGAVYFGSLNNCALFNNSAYSGGGANSATLNNCTLTGNSASSGGGAYNSVLGNSIVYFNSAASNVNSYGCSMTYCCTAPLPASGLGNFNSDPQLATASHLSSVSPCRGAGGFSYSFGSDIDGEPWANPPSVGCDELASAASGSLYVAIQTDYSLVPVGWPLSANALISGEATASRWDFGDSTTSSNQPYTSHVWATAGDYSLVLSAYNASNPGGVSVTSTIHVVAQPVHYVAVGATTPLSPYNSWATAATNIQDAVDAATVAGALILVSNGVYAIGGRVIYGSLSNRLAVTKPLNVQSVNGAAATIIQGKWAPSTNGDGAVRCVYLTNGASLTGFTIANGATRASGDPITEQSGGGVWCEPFSVGLSNCLLVGNSAANAGGGAYNAYLWNCKLTNNYAPSGGGVYGSTLSACTLIGNRASASSAGGGAAAFSTLSNCTVSGNSASVYGGATFHATLQFCIVSSNSATYGGGAVSGLANNCVLTGNTAYEGGGLYNSGATNCTVILNTATNRGGGTSGSGLGNCIIYFNSAPASSNWTTAGPLGFCCTYPMPNGLRNFTNAPLFVNLVAGNFRLQSNSPCINSGRNQPVNVPVDLDGNPRITGGQVDVGAFEFQTPTSLLSYAFALQYGLPTDGSADFADTDGDGLNNYQEWLDGTDPTDPNSLFKLISFTGNSTSGLTLTWQSIHARTYFVERSTNLAPPNVFRAIQSNLVGNLFGSSTTFTDNTATNGGSYFYRVGVQDPR